MKKEITLLLIACGLLLSSCAQSLTGVSKVYAFVKVTIPGKAMTNAEGQTENPAPQINRLLYIEYKGKVRPDIDTVFYNSIAFYSITLKPEDSEVGIKKETGEPVSIKVAKGNSLWKINLEQIDKTQALPQQATAIRIKIKSGMKAGTYSSKEVELTTPDMY
jgi:hypothetical protein